MRLVTVERDGVVSAGELEGSSVRLSRASSVQELLAATSEEVGLADAVVAQRTDVLVETDSIHLLAPVHRPKRNLFAVGWNYREHFQEGDATRDWPTHPTFFTKSPGTVIGARDPIRCDLRSSAQWDYEAEIAIVIGRPGRDIPEEQAPEHIAGFLLANDVTVRDVQRRHGGQWFKGKSFDETCPLGPALVTTDEVCGPIEFRLEIDGEVVQDASTDRMYFGFARLIAELSVGMTLEAGDIMLCGTPEGVGYARTPPRWLKGGQRLRLRSPQLGELDNRVVPFS